MSKGKFGKPKIVEPDDIEKIVLGDGGESPMHEARFTVPEVAAVMAIRNMVIFPGSVTPLGVGREKSSRLIEAVLPEEKVIVLVTQHDEHIEDPTSEQLYREGTAAVVMKLLRSDEGYQTLIVHGLIRVRIEEFVQTEPFFKAKITPLMDIGSTSQEVEARLLDVREQARIVTQLSPNVPEEAQAVLEHIGNAGALTDFLASALPLDISDMQEMLAETNVLRRLTLIQKHLHRQVEVLKLSGELQEQVQASIGKDQREYFLREQLKAIRKELGQEDEQAAEVKELQEKVAAAGMAEEV